MRLLKYINEEYFMRVKNSNNSVEVFLNPSRKEFKEIAANINSVRFIANKKTKKVYVWNTYEAIHSDMYKLIFKGDFQKETFERKIIPGIADVLSSGKSIMYSSDWLGDFFYRGEYGLTIKDLENTKKDFQWMNKYINIDRYFKDLKNDVNDRQDLTQFNKGL
jgi:hypothetical protein